MCLTRSDGGVRRRRCRDCRARSMGLSGEDGLCQNGDLPSGEETKCGTGEVGEEGYLISVGIFGSSE